VLGSFGEGDDVPGLGKVFHIGFTYVELVDGSGRHGRVTFDGAPPPPPPPTTAATDPWEGRLTRIDDHTFEVDRSLVRELVSGAARPGAVRITPIPGENGQLAGLRFSGVRPGSLPAALDIKNGDTISEINGAKITSANVLLDVLAKLDQLNVVEVDGTRGGKPLGITLRLR
jgi:membrane-associated protease RseP (regulator of RpoE activity)